MMNRSKLMHKLSLCLLALSMSVGMANGQSVTLGLPYIRFYSPVEYGGGIQNWHISQDRRGIIYVANNFGLLEYDGSSWRIYPVANGVKVRHFNFGIDNKISIASQGEFGYFAPDDQGQLRYTSLSQTLPSEYQDFEETWKVFHLNGKEYFCTSTSIFVMDKTKIDVIAPEDYMDNFVLINQQLYVNQPVNGLLVVDNYRLVPVELGKNFFNNEISAIIPLINDKLMVATKQDGVYILDNFNTEIWNIEFHNLLAQSIINTAIRLKSGDFVFGTQNNGLFLFSPEGRLISHLTKNQGLNNRTVICLFEDMQNNLWVGHNNGISYIELGQPFSFINDYMGLPGTGYDGFQDKDKLYLGTDNGLFVNEPTSGQSINTFRLIEESNGQVYYVNKMEKWLLMGHHNGGYVFRENQKPVRAGTTGTWMFLPLKTYPGYLIAGKYNGLDLYKKESDTITFVRTLEGLDESCRILEQDDHGNIWMTHGYKGVFKFRLSDDLRQIQDVQFYGAEKGLPSNVLISVFRVRGNLYFTTEDGIYSYDKNGDNFFKDPFFAPFFEPFSPLNVLAEDANQNIYFLGQQEIGVLIQDATGTYYKETNLLNKINGLLNDDLQDISILPNNKILYAAKEGFIVYNPNIKVSADNASEILFRRITLTAHGDSVIFYGNYPKNENEVSNQAGRGHLKFPFIHNSVKFEFSSTYMDGLGKTTYQYFLEGFDQDWSEWSNKNEKEYTNLNEGDYLFRIRAKNIYGQLSKEANYQFSILPPWYRSRLAYTSYFVLFSLSFSLLLFLIGQKHKREKNVILQEQEKELNKKDSELKTVKTETEREIEKLRTEKLKADISHKNKELATSTMHLINKNEFISQVKQNLTSLVSKNPEDPLANDLEKIMTSIEHNISSDDDWQHFEIHFDQVHGDFSQRLKDKYPNLSPQDRRMCTYLRMNMTTKEIANLLNITVRGAEISRYRLRKKLGLSRDTNLAEYILNF